MISERLARRLYRHHFPVAAGVVAGSASLYFTRPYPDVLSRLSFATAYPALALIAATLLVGPFRQLALRHLPVSLDLRRDIGIWAGVTGVVHAAVGQFVHLRGRPWLYYVYDDWRWHALPLRHDLFGLANFTGVAATLTLMALLATSNDLSLRRLGPLGWKQLQRWNYACFSLTALHCFLYQLGVETQKAPFVAITVIFVALAVTVQLAGFRHRREREKGNSKSASP